MDRTRDNSKEFTRQMAYHETKIRQEIIISQKSPGHVNNVTFWDSSSQSWIEPIWAQEESLWRGQNSICLTCEMADFERQIRHELLTSKIILVIFLIQLCEMFKQVSWIHSIQARECSLNFFWVSSPRTDLKWRKPRVDMLILLRCNQTCPIKLKSQKVVLK